MSGLTPEPATNKRAVLRLPTRRGQRCLDAETTWVRGRPRPAKLNPIPPLTVIMTGRTIVLRFEPCRTQDVFRVGRPFPLDTAGSNGSW
jgi:hypothetical protein